MAIKTSTSPAVKPGPEKTKPEPGPDQTKGTAPDDTKVNSQLAPFCFRKSTGEPGIHFGGSAE